MKKILSIIFLITTFFLYINPSFAQETETATQEAVNQTNESELREKVREKIEIAKNKPKAYLGIITDISEDTLQIKNEDEEIQLISLNKEETAYIKTNGSSEKAEFDDLAIGDFVVSMGYINDEKVFEAKRILVTSSLIKPVRKIIFGNVKEIVKKVF